jgi:hypothetical protein
VSDDDERFLSRVWLRASPLNYGVGLSAFASVAAPLLVGFSLGAVMTLLGRPDRGVHGDVALCAFTLAASLLLFAIQAGLSAHQLNASPDQRLSQTPEARDWEPWMEKMRRDQWRDAHYVAALGTRTRRGYNGGVVSFTFGLAAVLWPSAGLDKPILLGAFALSIVSCLVEIALAFGRPKRFVHWIMPTLGTARDEGDHYSGTQPDDIDFVALRRLLWGEKSASAATDLGSGQNHEYQMLSSLIDLESTCARMADAASRIEGLLREQGPSRRQEGRGLGRRVANVGRVMARWRSQGQD